MLTVRRLVDDVDDDGDTAFLLEGNSIQELLLMGNVRTETCQRSTFSGKFLSLFTVTCSAKSTENSSGNLHISVCSYEISKM